MTQRAARDLKVGDEILSPHSGRRETIAKVDTAWGITFVWTRMHPTAPCGDYAANAGDMFKLYTPTPKTQEVPAP